MLSFTIMHTPNTWSKAWVIRQVGRAGHILSYSTALSRASLLSAAHAHLWSKARVVRQAGHVLDRLASLSTDAAGRHLKADHHVVVLITLLITYIHACMCEHVHVCMRVSMQCARVSMHMSVRAYVFGFVNM